MSPQTNYSYTCFIHRTKDKKKRSERFFEAHDYLKKICESSHLQGLRYYGGPEVECKCKGPDSKNITRVPRFVEYNSGKNKREREAKCRKCFQVFKLDEIIDAQVCLVRQTKVQCIFGI